MSAAVPGVVPGIYAHYKGTRYRVIGAGMHTETEEPLVLYHQADDATKLWARPAAMFAETVDYQGETQPRFRLLEEMAFKGDGK